MDTYDDKKDEILATLLLRKTLLMDYIKWGIAKGFKTIAKKRLKCVLLVLNSKKSNSISICGS
jgi:hypothetical protein